MRKESSSPSRSCNWQCLRRQPVEPVAEGALKAVEVERAQPQDIRAPHPVGLSESGSKLGYGDGDEATPIGSGPDPNNRYATTYFRHAFNVADPAVFAALLVRLLRDDGGVVYLNGAEIFRSNMGGGAPDYATQALADALPADETTQFYGTNIPPALLRAGTNVVAVEIHQRSTNSSDLSFALELRGVEHDPRLAAARAGGEVWLTWPFPSAGYVLQSTTNLSSAVWPPVDGPVTFTNGQNRVTQPTGDPARFYRLRKP